MRMYVQLVDCDLLICVNQAYDHMSGSVSSKYTKNSLHEGICFRKNLSMIIKILFNHKKKLKIKKKIIFQKNFEFSFRLISLSEFSPNLKLCIRASFALLLPFNSISSIQRKCSWHVNAIAVDTYNSGD